jgi:preprotein translocase subunit SecA
MIYRNLEGKFGAVVEDIKECHTEGQPVLVGTISIQNSEKLSKMLTRFGIKHNVLNAKHHDKEAEIIAQAGRKHAVTIATNMAGRGVDIMLGGNPEAMTISELGPDAPEDIYNKTLEKNKALCNAEKEEVIALGGLYILGTERHESRRIDNQLRGRAGRQGDPGLSRFYLSMEDDLMRIFGGERMGAMMDRLNLETDEAIQHPWLSKAIAKAQKRVEDYNFSIRKTLLEYDDVMNQQRQTVYNIRRELLEGKDVYDRIIDMIDQSVSGIVDEMLPDKIEPRPGTHSSFEEKVMQQFGIEFNWEPFEGLTTTPDEVGKILFEEAEKIYQNKETEYGKELTQQIVRYLMLQNLDTLWKEHLLQMDHLKEGIGLRGYGHKDPLSEYKKEGFGLFQQMIYQFSVDMVERIMRVQVKFDDGEQVSTESLAARGGTVKMGHSEFSPFSKSGPMSAGNQPARPQKQQTVVNEGPKVGRNDPCPCGSGKKYKKCCGS